jgi:hypothetical protein
MKAYKNTSELVFSLGSISQSDVPEIRLSYNRSTRKPFLGNINTSESVANFLRKIYKRGEIELQVEAVT